MPDRSSYYLAAVYSAAGVLTGTLVAELFIRWHLPDRPPPRYDQDHTV